MAMLGRQVPVTRTGLFRTSFVVTRRGLRRSRPGPGAAPLPFRPPCFCRFVQAPFSNKGR